MDEAATAEARIKAIEAVLAAERSAFAAQIAELTKERDHLRASHERLRFELELLKRRMFVAKSERVDTAQLEMEFASTLAAINALGGGPLLVPSGERPARERRKPTGRRDLRKLKLPVERI